MYVSTRLLQLTPCHPWTGQCIPSWWSDPQACLLSAGFQCILQFSLHFYQLYLHSTPGTRSSDFHIYISSSHGVDEVWCCFFLSENLQNLKHSFSEESQPACGYDQDTLTLELSSHPSNCITFSIFYQPPHGSLDKILFCDTLVQTQYGTYNSRLYVLNYYCYQFSWYELLSVN